MGLSTTTRQRYRVDLSAEHAECESNYGRMQKLLPALADEYTIGLPGPGLAGCQARFSVRERTPYTTMMDLHISQDPALLPATGSATLFAVTQQLSIRLYHDARMAEVVGFQHRRKPAVRHVYPNARMFHPDEKWQWNRFLGEWLAYCQNHGCSLAPLALGGLALNGEAGS